MYSARNIFDYQTIKLPSSTKSILSVKSRIEEKVGVVCTGGQSGAVEKLLLVMCLSFAAKSKRQCYCDQWCLQPQSAQNHKH